MNWFIWLVALLLLFISDIADKAEANFISQFSGKLFLEQLAFHKDIDHSEPIEYIIPGIPDEEIKEFLIDKATDIALL